MPSLQGGHFSFTATMPSKVPEFADNLINWLLKFEKQLANSPSDYIQLI